MSVVAADENVTIVAMEEVGVDRYPVNLEHPFRILRGRTSRLVHFRTHHRKQRRSEATPTNLVALQALRAKAGMELWNEQTFQSIPYPLSVILHHLSCLHRLLLQLFLLIVKVPNHHPSTQPPSSRLIFHYFLF